MGSAKGREMEHTLRAREDRLFDEWRRQRPDLVADGVVDERTWLESQPRILFVLKEANNFSGDLREFLREGDRPQTWDSVARWVKGMRRLPDTISWSELSDIEGQRPAILRSIAVMNVKKSSGGHTSQGKELRHAARQDSELLQRQFSLYDADITICCGSDAWECFRQFVYPPTQGKWPTTSRGIPFTEIAPGRHVFAYVHPEARTWKELVCFGLLDAVREIRFPGR